MKYLFVLISLCLAGCASAMPPTVKPLATGSVQFPDDIRVTAVNIYKANDIDSTWILHTTIAGSANNFVTFPVDPNFKYYIAESTNSTLVLNSPYSNVSTNDSLKPVILKIK
jgi:hypothetical protein